MGTAVKMSDTDEMQVDSQPSDSDSAMGSSLESDTSSIRSSLYEGVEENGRTYHKYKQGQYYLPNDEMEQNRLDLQHHLFNLTFDGKLALAPISNPHMVLDIGTGTGLWAVDFGAVLFYSRNAIMISKSH